jgi:effector-binding domain-containing protein
MKWIRRIWMGSGLAFTAWLFWNAQARVLHGGYDGLGAAWQEFDDWVKASGHQTAPGMWEVYVAGPESGPDPAGYRTELNRPLAV